MSDRSSIEWTDATWNPVTGCTKVSPGCDHCYAETFAERWRGTKGHHFENGFDVQLRPERLDQPLKWRKPRRIFVNSMSDLFHDQVSDDYIARVFAVMAQASQHTFQILTKRHARMRSLLRKWAPITGTPPWVHTGPWPLPNVWLGVSVENQQWADIRIPALLDTPAAVRWISAEPLLGPVVLHDHWIGADPYRHDEPRLDWVVTGGESGPGARPAHPDWFRSLRDQCQAAGIPYYFKQRGAYTWQAGSGWREPDLWVHDLTGQALPEHELPAAPTGSWKGVWRVGKKRAGRELDGRTWDEYPTPRTAEVTV